MFEDELEYEARRIWQRELLPNHRAGRIRDMESIEERDSRRPIRVRAPQWMREPWQDLQRGFTNAGART